MVQTTAAAVAIAVAAAAVATGILYYTLWPQGPRTGRFGNTPNT